jgi:hypothetical protein
LLEQLLPLLGEPVTTRQETSFFHGEAVMMSNADVRQVIERMRKLADERATNAGGNDPCPPEAECDDCDTVRALREGASLIEAKLASQPAPSGWQQRIAAMGPWKYDGHGEASCHFCEVERYKVVNDGSADGKLREQPHEADCLWQNAVDALPPEPEVKDMRAMLADAWWDGAMYSGVRSAHAMRQACESALVKLKPEPDAKDAIPPQPPSRETKLREVFETCRKHLRERHHCANFDDFNVETLEWPADHDFEVRDATAEEQFEIICPRCLAPHMVDGDASSDTLCPKCQSLSVYGAEASPVKEEPR